MHVVGCLSGVIIAVILHVAPVVSVSPRLSLVPFLFSPPHLHPVTSMICVQQSIYRSKKQLAQSTKNPLVFLSNHAKNGNIKVSNPFLSLVTVKQCAIIHWASKSSSARFNAFSGFTKLVMP
jgi:hypothetical protein